MKPFIQVVLVFSLLAVLCAAPQPAAIAAAANPLELFLEASGAHNPVSPGQYVLRARSAALNRALLEQLKPDGSSVRLTLFSDAVFDAAFHTREDSVTGGYTLSGRLLDIPFGEVVLSIQGDTFFTSINSGDALYQARGEGSQVLIEQLDVSLLPPEQAPVTPPTLEQALPAEEALVSDDDGTRVDILVVYTTALANAIGESTVLARINAAVAESNLGFANSLITQRTTLAGTLKVTWDEKTFEWYAALDALRSGTAPFTAVPATRDAVRADLVILIANYSQTYCGLGYLMTTATSDFAAWAFSVVSNTCMTGTYTFAHEQGHNKGAHHDRYSVGSGTVLYPYAYGYWLWSPTLNRYAYRTIMAYDCTSVQTYSCQRINHWSNPAVSYLGLPTGVASSLPNAADNHLTLNNTAGLVAKFRDGLPPNSPANFTAAELSSTSFRLNWADQSNDEAGFTLWRAPLGTTSWTVTAVLPANTITYTDSGLVAGQNYTYKLAAFSGNGISGAVTVNAIHLTPTAPSTLKATAASMVRINLTWTDTSTNESGFKVERAPHGSSSWTQIASVPANTSAYSDASLPCSLAPLDYDYRVKAYNEVGESPYSPTATAKPLVCTTPAVPSPAVCITSLNALTVKWTNVDGETLYEVDYRLSTAVDWILRSAAKDTTSLRVAGLLSGSKYEARVRAVNAVGASLYTSCSATTKTLAIYLPLVSR